jgi:hypothetical protein
MLPLTVFSTFLRSYLWWVVLPFAHHHPWLCLPGAALTVVHVTFWYVVVQATWPPAPGESVVEAVLCMYGGMMIFPFYIAVMVAAHLPPGW